MHVHVIAWYQILCEKYLVCCQNNFCSFSDKNTCSLQKKINIKILFMALKKILIIDIYRYIYSVISFPGNTGIAFYMFDNCIGI